VKLWNLSFAMLAVLPVPAGAVCFHDGKLYAKTTLAQEFRESRWVVRARVESAGGPSEWTAYHLKLLRSYKGALPRHFTYFTTRDSGAFYLDRGAHPDLGGKYLLFLNLPDTGGENVQAARHATGVNYSCGQSRAWREVSPKVRDELRRMSRRSS
jgi:hypothetical protein